MNVLSLFDGMSCGRIALERAGIEVRNYYSSEVDKYAIEVANKNWPMDKQHRVGDVRNLKPKRADFFDLLIGGSPCQSFSFAGKKQGMSTDENIDIITLGHYLELKEAGFEFNGQSYLFWEFVRLLKETKPKYFLLENVKMPAQWEKIITDTLGVNPIEINSNLVSAQSRPRLYWTNIPNVTQPIDRGLFIKDILLETPLELFSDPRIEASKVTTKNYIKWDISGKGYYSQQDRAYFKNGKMCCVPRSQAKSKTLVVHDEGVYRRLSPLEIERLQTIPDNYTEGVSKTQRLKMIGNGWTIAMITHILRCNKDLYK